MYVKQHEVNVVCNENCDISAITHLLIALFAKDQADMMLMLTQLYVDIIIMITNVHFYVAKAKVDNSQKSF